MIYYVFWRDDKLSHIVWLQWDRVDIVTICPREIHVYYVGVCVCDIRYMDQIMANDYFSILSFFLLWLYIRQLLLLLCRAIDTIR